MLYQNKKYLDINILLVINNAKINISSSMIAKFLANQHLDHHHPDQMELKKMIEGITKKSPADQQLYNKEDAGATKCLLKMVVVMVMVPVMVMVVMMVVVLVVLQSTCW